VDIRDLEYFLACCKARSFTAAAREVHIVQSAMSLAIARLEQDLGASLFDRTGTPITLTEQGAALQAAAQRILDAVRAARDEVAASAGQVRGTVTLGSTLHTGRLDMAAVLSDVRERHPELIVQLRQASSLDMVQGVHNGSLDIALTAAPVESRRRVAMHPLLSEPMVFLCLPGHPLADRACITVADLEQETLMRPPPGWGTRAVIDAVLGATDSACEVANYALVAQLVRAGFATTLTPESSISGEMLAGLRAIPVDDRRLRWTLSAAVSADRRLTAATCVVLDALIREASKQPPGLALRDLGPRLPVQADLARRA
jgi:DNA-binding transcriptional LysR family regulator